MVLPSFTGFLSTEKRPQRRIGELEGGGGRNRRETAIHFGWFRTEAVPGVAGKWAAVYWFPISGPAPHPFTSPTHPPTHTRVFIETNNRNSLEQQHQQQHQQHQQHQHQQQKGNKAPVEGGKFPTQKKEKKGPNWPDQRGDPVDQWERRIPPTGPHHQVSHQFTKRCFFFVFVFSFFLSLFFLFFLQPTAMAANFFGDFFWYRLSRRFGSQRNGYLMWWWWWWWWWGLKKEEKRQRERKKEREGKRNADAVRRCWLGRPEWADARPVGWRDVGVGVGPARCCRPCRRPGISSLVEKKVKLRKTKLRSFKNPVKLG